MSDEAFFSNLRWYHYLGLTLGFTVAYQAVLMTLWMTFPSYDNTLLRFSLSNSDAMSISAWAMGIYAFYNVEKRIKFYDKKWQRFINLVIGPITDQMERIPPEKMVQVRAKIQAVINDFIEEEGEAGELSDDEVRAIIEEADAKAAARKR